MSRAVLAAGPLAAPATLSAQAWPQGDFRIVVPFPPRGIIDVVRAAAAPRAMRRWSSANRRTGHRSCASPG
jgi:tripartite-type tricarboxylate transporter receptor subunit TctC